jgi:hypothetical protein
VAIAVGVGVGLGVGLGVGVGVGVGVAVAVVEAVGVAEADGSAAISGGAGRHSAQWTVQPALRSAVIAAITFCSTWAAVGPAPSEPAMSSYRRATTWVRRQPSFSLMTVPGWTTGGPIELARIGSPVSVAARARSMACSSSVAGEMGSAPHAAVPASSMTSAARAAAMVRMRGRRTVTA